MLTKVEIHNCKSIIDASINLAPLTLFIGANGSGKTNFLQMLRQASMLEPSDPASIEKHINYQHTEQKIVFTNSSGLRYAVQHTVARQNKLQELSDIRVFSIDPLHIGQAEEITPNPRVQETGKGVVQVLDALKTGDREDLFQKIEKSLTEYIPEIEKLSFIPGEKKKRLQVREKFLTHAFPVSHLSEGTKFVIAILTIIFQEHPPTVVCIEEIDRGLHPRLLEKIIRVCFDISQQENMPQIIATTHNPYLVDQFKDHEDAVIIVEKEGGETCFTALDQRIEHVRLTDEDPLGELWFSGFIGGVPQKGAMH